MLTAAQNSFPIEWAVTLGDKEDLNVLRELKTFQEIIMHFQTLRLDEQEYELLKKIVLFKSNLNSSKELRDSSTVGNLRDESQIRLAQHISQRYPDQPQRFGQLLLLLPSLKSAIQGNTIKSVFFSCIGEIPIEEVICGVFKGEQTI